MWLRGLLKSGANGTTAFTLPYTLPYTLLFPIICLTGGSTYTGGERYITPAGNVNLYWQTGTINWFPLNGISFNLQ